jgi:hypothetical protein
MKVNVINQQFLLTLADCKEIPGMHQLTQSLWLHFVAVIVSRLTDYNADSNLYEVER